MSKAHNQRKIYFNSKGLAQLVKSLGSWSMLSHDLGSNLIRCYKCSESYGVLG